jgi:hypothetical protein
LSQQKLWEAFRDRRAKKFKQWLEYGANPEHKFDQAKDFSTFEQLCCEPGASEYILKCLDHKADPNRVRMYFRLHHFCRAKFQTKFALIRLYVQTMPKIIANNFYFTIYGNFEIYYVYSFSQSLFDADGLQPDPPQSESIRNQTYKIPY